MGLNWGLPSLGSSRMKFPSCQAQHEDRLTYCKARRAPLCLPTASPAEPANAIPHPVSSRDPRNRCNRFSSVSNGNLTVPRKLAVLYRHSLPDTHTRPDLPHCRCAHTQHAPVRRCLAERFATGGGQALADRQRGRAIERDVLHSGGSGLKSNLQGYVFDGTAWACARSGFG